jgi:hypothetical protein
VRWNRKRRRDSGFHYLNGYGWPADWNFAWSVRKAVAHKNEVYFRKQKHAAAPVTWRGLTYAPADNGKKVLHEDLWPADLIYLMMDLDTHLR